MAKWKPGQSGNPKGRPKGAKHKLSEAMYKDMAEDWAEHGVKVLIQVRETRPELYLQAAIRMLPTQHDMTIDDLRKAVDEYSTEELAGMVGAIKAKTNGKKAA